MMKRIVPVMAALAIVSQAGIALAQATPAAKPAAAEAAKPAPVTAPKARTLTGEVVSVDQKAETLTIKRAGGYKSKEYTFAVEKDAVSALSDLKPGDRVRVTYTQVAGGKMTAKALVNTSHTTTK